MNPDSKADKRPFAEKHSKLDFLFGLLLLLFLIVAFGFAVYTIVKCIATGVTAAANWLASLASKLEAVVIVALITGCVSIVGVLISSIVAKRIEYKRSRQEYLAKKREEPYGQFVDMVYKIQQNTKKGGSYTEAQMLEDLSQFSKQITLWGSSRVVNKWVKFRENGTNPELAQKNLLLLEDIMNEMRKDLGLNQRIIAGNAQFTGIAAGRGVGFTTGLLLLRKGLGMRETPIRPHSWHCRMQSGYQYGGNRKRPPVWRRHRGSLRPRGRNLGGVEGMTGGCGSGCDPAIHTRRLRVYHRPRRLRMASRISIFFAARRFEPLNSMG